MTGALALRHIEWDEPIRDDELPDEADLAESENVAVVPCPSCGAMIADEAERCRVCGDWVIRSSPAAQRASGWFWPVMVAVLVGVILVFWHGLGR